MAESLVPDRSVLSIGCLLALSACQKNLFPTGIAANSRDSSDALGFGNFLARRAGKHPPLLQVEQFS